MSDPAANDNAPAADQAKTPSRFATVGFPVLYRVLEKHETRTVRSGLEMRGSVFHPELVEFAALVTRVHADGSCDLVIFPPARDPHHLERVHEGADPGEFRALVDD